MKQTFFILIVATLFTACNNTMEEAYRMINLTGEDIMVHFTYPNHEVPADINGNTLAYIPFEMENADTTMVRWFDVKSSDIEYTPVIEYTYQGKVYVDTYSKTNIHQSPYYKDYYIKQSNVYMLLGSIPVDDYLFEITVDYILSLPEAVDGCALKD